MQSVFGPYMAFLFNGEQEVTGKLILNYIWASFANPSTNAKKEDATNCLQGNALYKNHETYNFTCTIFPKGWVNNSLNWLLNHGTLVIETWLFSPLVTVLILLIKSLFLIPMKMKLNLMPRSWCYFVSAHSSLSIFSLG